MIQKRKDKTQKRRGSTKEPAVGTARTQEDTPTGKQMSSDASEVQALKQVVIAALEQRGILAKVKVSSFDTQQPFSVDNCGGCPRSLSAHVW